jgi:hypothetical protein
MSRFFRRWWTRSTCPAERPLREPRRLALGIESLESRDPASSLIDLLRDSNQLIRFDSASPGTIQSTVAVSGLTAGDTLRSIDFSPNTGALYGLGINAAGTQARLYIINPVSGVATALPNVAGGLTASGFWGMSFDPVSGQIRVVNFAGENARLNPLNGSLAGNDTNLSDTNAGDSLAYSNQFHGATSATAFATNDTGDNLARIGGPGGIPSANGGLVTNIGPLGVNIGNFDEGLDFSGGTLFAGMKPNTGTNNLYTINTATGAATLQGQIGNGAGQTSGLAAVPDTRLVTASQAGGDVRVFTGSGTLLGGLTPFGAGVNFQVRVATGDVNRDGTPDIIAATGAGAPVAQVRIYDGNSLALIGSISPFAGVAASGYQGIEVAAGDVNGDGAADIIVAMGNSIASGVNGRIEVYSGQGFGLIQSFQPFDNFLGGIRVGTVDQNGDGIQEVIVGSGLLVPPPGISAPYGHVKTFDLSGGAPVETKSFFAFTGFYGGIFVAGGDVNGDGHGDIVASSGYDADHVKVWDGTNPNGVAFPAPIHSFFTSSGTIKGVRVALADFNQDGLPDIYVHQSVETAVAGKVAPQPLGASQLRVFVLPQTTGLYGTNVAPTAVLPVYGANVGASIAGARL